LETGVRVPHGLPRKERDMQAGHLFDGAGGMRLGFEQAGIQTAWKTDILYGEDIKALHPREFRLVDVICGGPPCVHTSKASTLSRSKTNQSYWEEMLRFVKEIHPRWVVVEQPASVDKGIIRGWVEDLQRLDYGVAGRIIDSRHWLPQQRSRWFIVGRLGVTGVALWNYLYPDSERVQREQSTWSKSRIYTGCCAECMPSGVLARVSDRLPALMGAGNAVSIPVARFLAEQIKRADYAIDYREMMIEAGFI
jgi:site-specific DNA-cytosine methylase